MKEIFNMINRKPEPMTILISLVAALLLSMILYGAYRLANTKESYQPQFVRYLSDNGADFYGADGFDTIQSGIISGNVGLTFHCTFSYQY